MISKLKLLNVWVSKNNSALIKILKFIVILSLIFLCFCVLFKHEGFLFNDTHSIPVGLYKKMPITRLHDGQLVNVCLPKSANFADRMYSGLIQCDNGMMSLIKPIGALEGEKVYIGEDGVYINNKMIKNTKPLAYDSALRPLSRFSVHPFIVEKGQVFLLSNYNKRSFDSRYFGPLYVNSIQSGVEPVYVFDK